MANTTWNPADKSAGITLSGGNLIAKNSNNAFSGVRAIGSQTTGKWYWEYTCDVLTSATDGVGAVTLAFPLSTAIGNPTGGVSGNFAVNRSGTVCKDGGTAGVAFGTIANGTTVCMALDLTGRLGWFRLGAAGLWNASGTANPATGIGGVSIPNLGSGIATYPSASVNNTNDQVTANFGDSAFVGAVPAGFVGGTSPPATTAPARVMVLA